MRVYVCGPIRAGTEAKMRANMAAFDAATERGRALGYVVISPVEEDRLAKVPVKPRYNPAEVRSFVERDVGILLSFRAEDGDAIALLPGWNVSIGARAEVALALWLGLEVIDALTFQPLEVVFEGFVRLPVSVVS